MSCGEVEEIGMHAATHARRYLCGPLTQSIRRFAPTDKCPLYHYFEMGLLYEANATENLCLYQFVLFNSSKRIQIKLPTKLTVNLGIVSVYKTRVSEYGIIEPTLKPSSQLLLGCPPPAALNLPHLVHLLWDISFSSVIIL